MADPKVRFKRSSVPGKIPNETQLPLGEIALNTYDGKVFASKNVGIGTTVFTVNPWNVGTGTDSYDINFTAGNVGVGSTLPTSKLDVTGNVKVSGIVTATSFSGSGSNLTGIVTSITAGSGIVIDQSTGNVTITSTGGAGAGVSALTSADNYIITLTPSFNGITTAFTMQYNGNNYFPLNEQQLLVSLGGVIQEPTTAYTVSSSTITFASAPNTETDYFITALNTAPLSRNAQSYNVTGVQTNFTLDNGYTIGYVDVYLNGARLVSGDDYTANNGTTVGLTSAAQNGDVVEVVGYKAVSLSTDDLVINGNLKVVGITTLGNYVQVGVGSTALIVTGDARVTGILTVGSSSVTIDGINNRINVGTGLTISNGIVATGVITATSFVGDGSGLTGAGSTVVDDTSTNETLYPVLTAQTSGTITASKVSTTKLSFNPSTGVVSATTFNGNITGTAATFTGNVSIAGTLTYEDVTNVDSIGIVTARSGVQVTGGNLLVGSTSATGTASQPLQVTGGAYVSGNLGVGVTNTTFKLQLGGETAQFANSLYINRTSHATSIRAGINLGGDWVVATDVNGNGTRDFGLYSGVLGLSPFRIDTAGNLILNQAGAGSSTGTSSQPLQVTGGAYVSGRLGVGATNPLHLLDVNGNIGFGTASVTGVLGSWGAGLGDTDIDSLLPGSTFGSIIEGAESGHIVIGIRDNDVSDSFSIISGGSNYQTDTTYDTLIAYFKSDGNVGLGTNSPAGQLNVRNGPVIVGSGTSTGTASQTLQVTGGAYVSGNLGVGNTNPSVKLAVTGEITATSNITAYSSDQRLKENIKNLENPLEKVLQLNGCSFDWNEKSKELGFTPKHETNDIGLLAQEVEKVLPQAVAPAPFDRETNEFGENVSKSGENYLTIQYERLVPLLVEAIKEQQEQINTLKERLENLGK